MAKLAAALNAVANLVLILGAAFFISRNVIQSRPPTAPEDWRDEIATGISWGSPEAPLKIVEFMDMECPFCAVWGLRLDSLFAEAPSSVQVTLHHFPIESIHPKALAAAVAVECADRQGMARSFTLAVLKSQEELQTRPLTDFAFEAGMTDLNSFAQCIELPADSFPRIEYGRRLGEKNRVRGTPTVWVNGEVRVPTLVELRRMIGGAAVGIVAR